jgi:hypothetical protein
MMEARDDDLLARYLDGEIPRDALPDDLRRQAGAFDDLFAPLRAERVRFPGGFREAVMRRVRRTPPARARRAWGWIVTPRTFRFSPGAAALAAVAVILLVVLTRPGTLPEPVEVAMSAPAEGGVDVRFVFVAPQATRVAVTGTFADWDAEGIPMRPEGDGRWVAEVRLPAGMHQYVFVVDGAEWRPDPNATSQMDDGFGQQNSVLLVPERRAS